MRITHTRIHAYRTLQEISPDPFNHVYGVAYIITSIEVISAVEKNNNFEKLNVMCYV